MKVAVVVLAYNESKVLRACLESVRWADEIVVVDGHSTDETVSIAREFTEKVFLSDLLGPKNPGGYSDQRNFALQQASSPWIFFLDADERCTPELASEIRHVLSGNSLVDVAGYRIRRKEYFFGIHSPHTHGESWLTRLLCTDRVRWNDRLVHEGVVADGEIRSLEGRILHRCKDSVFDYLTTQNRYTSLEAQQLAADTKPLSSHPLMDCFRTFCNIYIYKGGYREGAFGLIMSFFFASYTFQTWAKHWESEVKAGRVLPSNPRFRVFESLAAILHVVWTTLRPKRE
jgi:(heptosyl)LPS beta-1,4-glucosyltransferase